MATYSGDSGDTSKVYVPGDVITFSLINRVVLIFLLDGSYEVELWGGKGCDVVNGRGVRSYGGNGGYTKGTANLIEGVYYICVGGAGTNYIPYASSTPILAGGYNGGGSAGKWSTSWGGDFIVGSGGGCTHFSSQSGLLQYQSLGNVIAVAGGGGGAASHNTDNERGSGGYGGGSSGVWGSQDKVVWRYSTGSPGSQTGPGTNSFDSRGSGGFGYGGSGYGIRNLVAADGGGFQCGAGGGSGLWGGGAGNSAVGAGGGSGYIGGLSSGYTWGNMNGGNGKAQIRVLSIRTRRYMAKDSLIKTIQSNKWLSL